MGSLGWDPCGAFAQMGSLGWDPCDAFPRMGSLGLVQVDYHREDGLGPGDKFAKPMALVMPHCFSPEEGTESVVMLGCPHGQVVQLIDV